MNPSDNNWDPLRLIDDPFGFETRKNKRFWYACRNGKLKKARRLLRQGADVNVERRCFILKRGHRDEGSDSEMISDDSGADSDAETLRRNPEGFWAACRGGNMEKAQRQMWYYKMKRKHPELWRNHMPEDSDWDSDDEQEDRDSQRENDDRYEDLGKVSALYVAIKRAHFDIALHLLDQPGIDNLAKKYTEEKETVLHRAVAKEAEDVYQKLIEHRHDRKLGESKDKEGDSAIQIAVIFGDVVATRVLLASRFGNPHSLESLLSLVAFNHRSRPPKNVDVARLLLMNGARLGLEDGDGKTTALQTACEREDVGMVKLLLAWKAPRIPIGRDDALRLAGDELWQNKDETKPAWSNSISRQHEISANFNIEITFSCAVDVNGDGSYTRNWTRSMPIKDFMG
ncbi:uncharacterized protein PODANS_6_9550 [Podospora anserina S mat+]|uniref:Podospora anserina S mat+ genomic DNA chromosome 6, supercontig 4 n=1 Tax=Podospora anserina (strain S / ATCC MYA-4624 / DSM 980 / FGSC 10383) TaxID=515849 RepID=B2ANN1_PODAN|nr:uncharacterized protein PODANS_6_9550 [Podospora anserina S mat+]CAP65453.1 unnamed protein product [Podospora anserina S mat+]CDP31449.1 Putative protein of unknown function [Podospora anserina S mat+]